MEKRYFEDVRVSLSIQEKALKALRYVDEEIIRTTGDVDRILASVLEMIMATTGAKAGAFFKYDHWLNAFLPVYTIGYPVGIQVSSQRTDEGLIGVAAREERPVVVSDTSSPESEKVYCSVIPDTKSVLAFPICDKENENKQVIALITLEDSEPGFFRQEHVDILEMFAVKALIGINYGEFLARNTKSIRALQTLGVIAARSHSATHDQNTIIWLFLTGMTAYEGLGFGRAMVFLKSEEGDALEGVMGVGELDKNKAILAWEMQARAREAVIETGKDVLQSDLERVERMSAAIKAGLEVAPDIARAIKKQKISLDDCASALLDCLHQHRCRIVKHDEDDPFRATLAAMTCGADRGSAFVCVPIASRDRTMGVIVADNRWFPSEQQASFDQSALVTYANILAIELENERLRKAAAFTDVFSEIGHDFNRQLTRLTSAIASLNYEIHRAPAVEEIFWNSAAGDLFKQLLAIRDDIARFARDFQAFGRPLFLKTETVELGAFIEEQIQRKKRELVWEENTLSWLRCIIEHKRCPEQLNVVLDRSLIERAIDAILNNAIQAMSENENVDPEIVVATRIETDRGGGSLAVISIADNGPGVPLERKQRIFQPFFTTRGSKGGSGLGLASARRYIEAHGGSLREIGKFGEGAEFVIKLPMPNAL